jgi:hypothetical protein
MGDPSDTTQITDYTVSEQVTFPPGSETEEQSWGAYLADQATATAYFDPATGSDTDEVEQFIGDTAFTEGERLLYVRTRAPQSCYELTIDTEPSVSDSGDVTVGTAVSRTAPANQSCPEVVTPVALLLRVSFAAASTPPSTARVSITGAAEGSVNLTLTAEPS